MDSTVIAALITSAPAAATAVLALHVRKGNAENRRANEVVRAQVANSHTTNLRDDLDKVITGLETVLTNQAQQASALAVVQENQRRTDAEIGGLRADMRVEREERLALARHMEAS
jgi:hypothetical protein